MGDAPALFVIALQPAQQPVVRARDRRMRIAPEDFRSGYSEQAHDACDGGRIERCTAPVVELIRTGRRPPRDSFLRGCGNRLSRRVAIRC
ncbi:hypothetical protein D1114_01405 [Cereibacter sphaeroides]|uniref:Uncharacterized protein n=1 Tax=Cereibacter sphaeroides TaxID=1063 RepID=A0AAX1URB8_CERSP|nr:hypothetical protein D1114_01405 [Cereibacter sphaeroides]